MSRPILRPSAVWRCSSIRTRTVSGMDDRFPRLLPPDDSNSRTYSRSGGDFEFVGEALGASQAEAHSISGGVPVTEGQINIRNAGTLVFKHQPDSRFPLIAQRFEQDRTTAAVIDGVAGELARGGDKLRLIDEAAAA